MINIGMFDTIADELFCPFCGKTQPPNSFQTKDTECMLNSWTLEELQQCYVIPKKRLWITMYTECKECKKWIELRYEIR